MPIWSLPPPTPAIIQPYHELNHFQQLFPNDGITWILPTNPGESPKQLICQPGYCLETDNSPTFNPNFLLNDEE
jgi:hypothetical protein